ncbi:MAG: glycosyltransferase family 4 protein [Chthonomonadaceae bacterium]|nr:glycosyltransferase family 4 protein [Chthonomonadaceae bacterium]
MRIGISGMWLSSAMGAKNSGLSRYAAALLDAMLPLAPEDAFDLFTPDDFEAPEPWLRHRGFAHHPVRIRSLPARVFWEHVTAGRLARSIRADWWFSAAQAIPFSGAVPRAVMIHDMIPLLFPEFHPKRTVLYYRWALRHSCRNAKVVFANSEATKNDLVQHLGADPAKILVTPLGPGNRVEPVSPESVAFEQLAALGVRRESYVLTLCNLDYRKNLARLVEAFAMLRDDTLGLVVVGANRGYQHAPLLKRIEELGLADRVDLLGYVPDGSLPALFAKARLFAFPSLYEGFGLPVLEAMALGAPVVCSATSSLPEVGGEAVRTFDPTDTASMAAAMETVLEDEALRGRMVRDGLERARVFTWKRTAETTLEAFSCRL